MMINIAPDKKGSWKNYIIPKSASTDFRKYRWLKWHIWIG